MSAAPWVLWVAGALAFLLVALAMPWAIRGWQALARPDREISLRNLHQGEIARVGGFVLMLHTRYWNVSLAPKPAGGV